MIISASRHPNNDSLYARHRSTTKGHRHQLKEVVQALKNADDKVIFEEFSPSMLDKYGKSGSDVVQAFAARWGMMHYAEYRSGVLPVRRAEYTKDGFNIQYHRIPNNELKSDFKLIIYDLTKIQGVRQFRAAKHGYLCVFVGDARLEVIAAKNGATPGHHFFHWQAIAKGQNPNHVCTVDDLSTKDDE
jgi:hypothetical protein